MNKLNEYFDRKFFSKVGRATHASCKPQYSEYKYKEKAEVNMEFIQTELQKVQSELSSVRKTKKKVLNSSSFLTTTRDGYMKAFVFSN